MNDPYARDQPLTSNNNQSVGTSNILWGESDENYDNDHKNAGCCACSAQVSNLFYGIIIVVGTLLAFLSKLVSQKIFSTYFNFCPKDTETSILRDLCVQNQTVYRISAVMATFFLMMAIITFINRKFHYESWIFKASIISGLFTVSFFIPGHFFAVYREIARWCSMIFIILQVLVLVDFAHSLHENIVKHVSEDGNNSTSMKARVIYLFLAFGSLATALTGIIILYVLYNPCTTHTWMITITLILSVIVTGLSLLDVISKGLLPPALITIYCTLITYQALSTNNIEGCHVPGMSKNMPTWLMVCSFLFSVLQVAWMSVRAGTNNRMFVDSSIRSYSSKAPINMNNNDPYGQDIEESKPYQSIDGDSNSRKSQSDIDESSPNPPKHWIFHLTLVTCAMYVAMMLTGWGNETATSINNPEASVQSFWIKMVSVWLSFALYFWTLIAPIIFPDRDFS